MSEESKNVTQTTEPAAQTANQEAAQTAQTAPGHVAPKPAAAPPPGLKAMLEKEKAIREKEAQLAAYEQEVNELRQLRELSKTNKSALLEKLGIDLAELGVPKKEEDPSSSLEKKLAEMEKFVQAQREKEEAAQRTKQEQESRKQFRDWIATTDYKAVQAADASDAVYDYIHSHYQQTGEVLSEEQAASEVEARLLGVAEKLLPLLQVKQGKQGNTQPRTLTGEHVASGGVPDLGKLTEEEALRYLADMLG